MKSLNYWVVALLFIFTSCNDMLELNPNDSISEELAIQNEDDIKKAILSCYDALQADNYYGRGLVVFNEIGTDNAFNGGTIIDFGQVNNNNVLADNIFLDGIWSAPYISINRCNTVIYHLNRLSEIPQERKENYLAEVLFIRALNYYNLTRLFKDIPLKLTPTLNTEDLNVPLSSQATIYAQIQTDLALANNRIINTNPFYATNLAVKMLLAKANLELGYYQNAISYADTIISGNRQLLDSYSGLYTTEGSSESIFELQYTIISTDKNRLAEYCYPTSLNGRYEIAPEASFINSFEPNDQRRNLFLGTTPYCNKYESIGGGDDNVIVFRLAEVYLLRAEARALANGDVQLIQNDINTIRHRAGVDSVFNSSYPQLLSIIETERRHEFAFEGHRWFDLVRTGRAGEVLGISEEKYYFPIPLTEVNANDSIN